MIATAFFLYSIAAFADLAVAPTKVACVGDSITYGGGVRDKNSYPAQLGVALGDKWSVENFGVSGATLLKNGDKPYWNLDRYQAALKFQPNIVIIKLGTNDSKSWNWLHKSEYVSNYIELIKSFQNLESKPTVWISYPVPAYSGAWGIFGEVITSEIIPMIDEVAKKADVTIVDLYSALSGKNEFFPDGIHPNAEGSKLMAATVANAISEWGREVEHENPSDKNSCAIAC